MRNASTLNSLLHCPSQKLIVPMWFGCSGNFVKDKKASFGYQSCINTQERSLPYSRLGKAFRSAANLRETSAPDNGLLTFSLTVTIASFLPQDPFSNYLYFNNSSYLHLTDFHSCMTFSHYRFAHFSWLNTQVKASQVLQQHAIYI